VPARKRLAAVAALAAGGAAVVASVGLAFDRFPRGLVVLACVAVALWLGVHAITRRRWRRAAGLGLAAVLLGVAVALVVGSAPVVVLATVVAAATSVAAARTAFRAHVDLPSAPAPQHPVLFYNPRSGGGKAERFALRDEALARGIKPVELTPGTDLEELVRGEVAAGADALAMAGGDGSQAVVAAVAAETGLPYGCVPAGTRNHFALDLGVDRDDVVGALDAFVDGGERVVDLADVNGRVFVNNVSLGLYADAVQRAEYRDAKLRTLLDTVPEVGGREADGTALHWRTPGGDERLAGVVMLVSNNPYRVGRAVGSGTRPRLDGGELGVVVLGATGDAEDGRRGWHAWTVPALEVDGNDGGDGTIAAGIDGEAVRLTMPLEFHIRPAALRVRIARTHPGASPAALRPEGAAAAVRTLGAIALGRGPE
jgi:diacylglycerol kinase family enzyme